MKSGSQEIGVGSKIDGAGAGAGRGRLCWRAEVGYMLDRGGLELRGW